MKRVIGVDLGTTLSSVSVVDHATGRPALLANADGKSSIPTAIWYRQGEVVVGERAMRAAVLHPDDVFIRFKPKLDDPGIMFGSHGPTELVAEVIRYLKAMAEAQLSDEVGGGVFAVPAWMPHTGRQVIQDGAALAGLAPERLVNEPVAAAHLYALDCGGKEGDIVFVGDPGGGTTDASVVELSSTGGTVLANAGDMELGGQDFDRAILEWWREQWIAEFSEDPLTDPAVVADWIERAERSKQALSRDQEVTEYLTAAGQTLKPTLSRRKFEQLISSHITRIEQCAREALTRAGVRAQDVDTVLLVGGSTRVPAVREAIGAIFGRPVGHLVDPTSAVAKGAAIIAADLDGTGLRDRRGRPFLKAVFTDVAAHGLGIEAIDENTGLPFNHVLIPAGTILPARGTGLFHPQQDDATAVKITLIEGSDRDISKCTILQRDYELPISVSRKKENVEVKVTLIINADGIVEVEAEEPGGGVLREQFRRPEVVRGGEERCASSGQAAATKAPA